MIKDGNEIEVRIVSIRIANGAPLELFPGARH